MDIKDYSHDTEYILPCTVNIPSEDKIVIDFVTNVSISMVFLFIYYVKYININYLTLFQKEIHLFWVCLYAEENLDIMERDLKIETLPTGVKRIDYEQCRYPDNTHTIY